MKQTLIYEGIVYNSEVNGPGRRNVLFVRGCPHACRGCYNAGLWDLSGPHAKEAPVERVAELLLEGDPEGVAISGGEPLYQLTAMMELLMILSARKVSVVLFTGYTLDQIKRVDLMATVLNMVDILVSGPYVAEKASFQGLRGSDNQDILVLKGSYDETDLKRLPHSMEVHAEPPVITGFPNIEMLEGAVKCPQT